MKTQNERQIDYNNALISCLEEFVEIEKQVKILGKRLNALRFSCRGLAELTNTTLPDNFNPTEATVVLTKEDRIYNRK